MDSELNGRKVIEYTGCARYPLKELALNLFPCLESRSTRAREGKEMECHFNVYVYSPQGKRDDSNAFSHCSVGNILGRQKENDISGGGLID